MPNGPQTTILDIIKIVLPNGTVTDATGWDSVCDWPPDLFAVVATITERAGLYAEPTFVSYWNADFSLTNQWIKDVCEVGDKWALKGSPPQEVLDLWKRLITKHRNDQIVDSTNGALVWKKIIFELLAISDEASAGIGFLPSATAPQRSAVQYTYYKDYATWQQNIVTNPQAVPELLPYLPHSVCVRVSPAILCVQPKTSTPAVGCTLRSLTHHLALLPSVANVSTHWHLADKPQEDLSAFNLLIVPFPYSLPGTSFRSASGKFPGATSDRAFYLDADAWMRGATPDEFAEFLCGLIEAAKAELEPVHAIVLPETALKIEFADQVAGILAKKTALDLFVVGVLSKTDADTRNSAAIYRFADGKIPSSSFQSKHHRWCLSDDQIRRYHLGHVLDPACKWWEQIDVSYRSSYVTLFRRRATLSVLICEDLARYDPVLTVMNAIGPNLVIALLMDGPQFEHRWPGRYATALADDPGSAVLTLTSLGMVNRAAMPGELQNREIALWKEPDGRAQALKLPKGDHALLLTLTSREVEQITLDGRGDGGATVHFGLGAAHGIRHKKPPDWLGTVP